MSVLFKKHLRMPRTPMRINGCLFYALVAVGCNAFIVRNNVNSKHQFRLEIHPLARFKQIELSWTACESLGHRPLLLQAMDYDRFETDKSIQHKNTGPKNESTLRNEFSRTIRVSKWFASTGGGLPTNRGSGLSKSINVNISASEPERHALATRFRLSNITALSAEMVVQPAFGFDRGGGKTEDHVCIEASGTVTAQVKQTCVRTNEDFEVDLEFNFETTLKAVASSNADTPIVSSEESDAVNAALTLATKLDRSRTKKSGKQNGRRVKGIRGEQSSGVDDLGVEEIQNIFKEYEISSDIIEDESCFCIDGILDVGEIVSQILRSKLDPYPKIPGSVPVKYTFTF